MKLRALRTVVVAAIMLVSASSAAAHPAPFSYLDIAFRGGNLEGSLTVHVIDIAHELNVTPPESVLDQEFLTRNRQRILDLLTPRISLSTDRPLKIEWGAIVPMKKEDTLPAGINVSDEDYVVLS